MVSDGSELPVDEFCKRTITLASRPAMVDPVRVPYWDPRDYPSDEDRQQVIWLTSAVIGVIVFETFLPLYSSTTY